MNSIPSHPVFALNISLTPFAIVLLDKFLFRMKITNSFSNFFSNKMTISLLFEARIIKKNIVTHFQTADQKS